jgi:hypothetical protein
VRAGPEGFVARRDRVLPGPPRRGLVARGRVSSGPPRGGLVARRGRDLLGAARFARAGFAFAPAGGDSGTTSGRGASGGNAGVEAAISGHATTVTKAASTAQARDTLPHRTRRKTSRRML